MFGIPKQLNGQTDTVDSEYTYLRPNTVTAVFYQKAHTTKYQ
jgi:hypothetical protein